MTDIREPLVDTEMLKENKPRVTRAPSPAVSQKSTFLRWNKKDKGKSAVARTCTWIVGHQISISLTLLSTLYLMHTLHPSIAHHTRKFFRISYYNPVTGTFALGWDDIFFVFHWIIVFSGLRCIFMDYILSPLADILGLKKRKAKTRFAEQAWMIVYYTVSWSSGFYLIYNSDYFLDLRALWRNWPIREMDGLSKWYYLVQFAFWLQQIVVVNIEERRKDHWQMFSHHLVTCALIFGSYGYHCTKVGNVILCLMDVVDLFLPLAKILKYLQYQTACDLTFGLFIVSWFITRHILYMWVVWSTYAHIPVVMDFGCYKGSVTTLTGPFPVPNDWKHVIEPFLDPVGTVCFDKGVQWTFISLLLALQFLLLMWFVMIVKVAYKVITGGAADDSRSDDEDSAEDEIEDSTIEKKANANPVAPIDTKQHLLEKEVLSTDASFSPSQHVTRVSSRSRRKADGHSSGVNLLAGSDRKELLGRIGCDKSTDS